MGKGKPISATKHLGFAQCWTGWPWMEFLHHLKTNNFLFLWFFKSKNHAKYGINNFWSLSYSLSSRIISDNCGLIQKMMFWPPLHHSKIHPPSPASEKKLHRQFRNMYQHLTRGCQLNPKRCLNWHHVTEAFATRTGRSRKESMELGIQPSTWAPVSSHGSSQL